MPKRVEQKRQHHPSYSDKRLRDPTLTRTFTRRPTVLSIPIHRHLRIPIRRVLRVLARILHGVHSNIQEGSATEKQQNARHEPRAHALRQAAVAQQHHSSPGDQGARGRREREDDEVRARGALREPLLEERGREPEGRGRFVDHQREEDDHGEVAAAAGRAAGRGCAERDAVGAGVDDEADGCRGGAHAGVRVRGGVVWFLGRKFGVGGGCSGSVEAELREVDLEALRLRGGACAAGEGVDQIHEDEAGNEGDTDVGVRVTAGVLVVVVVVGFGGLCFLLAWRQTGHFLVACVCGGVTLFR